VSLRRATGQAAFAGDHALAGTLQLALRRSPHAHARVRGASGAAARALPGVVEVLTHAEAPRLFGDVARFVGDRLAVVAAEELDVARHASELVEIDLEPLEPTLDAERAAREPSYVAARVAAAEGDVDAALAAAERVVTGEWSLPFRPAFSLEGPVALTWLDEDQRLVVRSSSHSPFQVRGALAERLGVPAARIRVERPLVAGGGLGHGLLQLEDVCALVTLRTGRPAQLALRGEEGVAAAAAHPAQRVRLRLGLAEGRLAALDVSLLVDLGADAAAAESALVSAGRQALGLYRIPHLRFEAVAVRTNRPPASPLRGADGLAFALECALDEAARGAGLDPAVLRRAQLRRPGDPGAAVLAALGEPAGADDASALAELLRAAPARGKASARPLGVVGPPRRHGTGLAVARAAPAADGRAGSATLRLLDDGSFTLSAEPSIAGSIDERTYAEAAAKLLGVPAQRVVCVAADTDSAPYPASDGARAGGAPGRAVEEVAALARERIRAAGAAALGVPLLQASLGEGRVAEPGGRALSFGEIGAAALRAGQPLVVTATLTAAGTRHSLAAAFAELEVDLETGAVEVSRLECVVAGGPFDDPLPATRQVEGGLAAALEQALASELCFDDDGRPLLAALRRLAFVAALDVPPLGVGFVPLGEPLARFAPAANGEAAARAALAALANAIARASGSCPRALPLSPARILEAIAPDGARP
jgi:putative selenate reductase molybdopterin-binding subunit